MSDTASSLGLAAPPGSARYCWCSWRSTGTWSPESAAALHAAAAGLAAAASRRSFPTGRPSPLPWSCPPATDSKSTAKSRPDRAWQPPARTSSSRSMLCSGLPMIRLSALFEELRGTAAVEHLFAVAAGLDSVVVGEREVAGQVRRALSDAQAAGTTSGRLGRLFQAASRTAKDVGAQTALSSASRSIASVALDLAAAGGPRDGTKQAGIAGASAVLFGTGAYAGCVAELLRNRKCSDISVFSHSGRAEAFVAARGGARPLRPVSCRQPLPGQTSSLAAAAQGPASTLPPSPGGVRVRPVRSPSSTSLPAMISTRRVGGAAGSGAHHAGIGAPSLLPRRTPRRCASPAPWSGGRHATSRNRKPGRAVDTAVVALREHLHQVLHSEMERVSKQHGRVCLG